MKARGGAERVLSELPKPLAGFLRREPTGPTLQQLEYLLGRNVLDLAHGGLP